MFFAAPLLFFFTGVLPIPRADADFMLHFAPSSASFLLSEVQARGRTSTWAAERFHMVKFWTYTRAVFSIFSRRRAASR